MLLSAVDPGAYNTDILKPALARSITKGFNADRAEMKPPDEVAAVVLEALFDPRPKRRYLVVPNQAETEETIRAVMGQLAQLNEAPRHGYDRAALIRMLDEAMAMARER